MSHHAQNLILIKIFLANNAAKETLSHIFVYLFFRPREILIILKPKWILISSQNVLKFRQIAAVTYAL
jgi:hypothetical protein